MDKSKWETDWDHTIEVGSLVKGYHKGFWKVTNIEEQLITARDLKYSPHLNNKVGDLKNVIIHYTKIMGDDYSYPYARLNRCCGIGYVKVLTARTLQDLKDEYARRILNFTMLLNGDMDNWKDK